MKINFKRSMLFWMAAPLAVALVITLTACSSSPTSTPSQTALSTPQPTANASPPPTTTPIPNNSAPRRGSGTNGTITNIDGDTITLNTPQGQVTVNVGSNTAIQKTVTGALTDLQTGQFLTVTGTADSSGNIVATSITMRAQSPNPGFTPIPRASISPGEPYRPGGTSIPRTFSHGTGSGTFGTLTNINGNTLTLNTMQGQQVIVSVGSNTIIQKMVSGTISDLAVGESLSVMGSRDANGNINAVSIMIGPEGASPSSS